MSADEFDRKGFLSDYVYEYRDNVRTLYFMQFDECAALSEKVQDLVVNSAVAHGETSKVCSLLFAERTLRSCQAAVRLCEIGMVQEAQVLTRAGLETMFHSSALIVDPSVIELICLHDETEGKKFADGILKNRSEYDVPDSKIEFLESLQSRGQGKTFSVYNSAKIAKMLRLYDVEYRFLSAMAGHATIRSLERSVAPKNSGFDFYMGPSANQLKVTLSIVRNCLEQCLINLKIILGE